jgi:hypothetical protein
MATYEPRKAARPIPEVWMWMVEGFAVAIQSLAAPQTAKT